MSVEEFNSISPFICDHISKHAKETPKKIALIDADDAKWITYEQFDDSINLIAHKLLKEGFQKGDIVANMLPLLLEHIYFEYACFKIGVIWAPLDVRLKSDEAVRSAKLLDPKAKCFMHPDDTDSEDKWGNKKFYDFKQIAREIRKECPFIQQFIQFSPIEDCDKGTQSALNWIRDARREWTNIKKDPKKYKEALAKIDAAAKLVKADDPILIIYTTGTTGFPKPAMLTNQGITAQNLCLSKGFDINVSDRMLVNLPPSHVGCQTEQLMTPLFAGGSVVFIHGFKADKSMKAIEAYKVTALGQIPSLFVMEWRLKNYKEYDLSSLKFALYGGQAVSKKFLEKLSGMAKFFGSGLGLTELSGFVSYTPLDGTVDDILASLGRDFPITPLSIRKVMKEDGYAGEELPNGEIGEVCYSGPQVFKGYFGNEEATRKAISKDGVCYTGDLGFKDEKGLHLVGRSKFVIKPKGYQVYPPDIEAFIEKLPEVSLCAVVGAKHEVFTEGVVAFIELRKGKTLDAAKIHEHCKGLTAYMRPSLIVFLDEIPLNRVDKTDYAELNKTVEKYVNEERARGGWDAK
jgi:acyl-CoA synthetase (AMP-forming)/AMP-acid ligase II